MVNQIVRFVREGSLAVAVAVAIVAAPTVAEASLWDDIKEIASPEHFVGKAVTGSTLAGVGIGGAVLVAGLGAPVIAVGALVAVGVVGTGLLAWGIYELVADANGWNSPATVPATLPGTGETTRPNGGTNVGRGADTTGGVNPILRVPRIGVRSAGAPR